MECMLFQTIQTNFEFGTGTYYVLCQCDAYSFNSFINMFMVVSKMDGESYKPEIMVGWDDFITT